jgi:hypothetical protein
MPDLSGRYLCKHQPSELAIKCFESVAFSTIYLSVQAKASRLQNALLRFLPQKTLAFVSSLY